MFFFFFIAAATTEIYTLSLHDALPILDEPAPDPIITSVQLSRYQAGPARALRRRVNELDRKSTRLNSSHTVISYAVFCLKKKNLIPVSTRRKSLTSSGRCI